MKNETKRPGDSPPFDEHANEDSYFALKEHELLEEMKVQSHKLRAALREAQMAICPKCSAKLQKYQFMGFMLERCENCEGIWLKKGELEGILRRHGRGPLGAFLDRCFAPPQPSTKA